MSCINPDGMSYSYMADIWGNEVTWADMSQIGSIYLYQNNSIINLTNSYNKNGIVPSIWNGKIAWSSLVAGSEEIFYWDGALLQRITNNNTNDFCPSLYSDKIVWFGWDGYDYELFMWQNGTTSQLTNNDLEDRDPCIFGNWIAWIEYDGSNYSINVSNGTYNQQISSQNNPIYDLDLYIGNGQAQLVYASVTGTNSEIFYASATIPEPSQIFIGIVVILSLMILMKKHHKLKSRMSQKT